MIKDGENIRVDNGNCKIIGFRRDRIGARLICLLNTIRISKKFNVSGRFIWLSEPDGPYPELVDPRDFLVHEFVERHIEICDRAPDKTGRKNLNALAPSTSSAHFAQMLQNGDLFECDSMSDIVRLMDESPTDVAREVREIASQLPLSDLLESALIEARERITAFGGGQPIAIHMRRGDLLDGDPWSYSGWPAKFVPDEFFRAFISENDGPVIAFSDTPEVIGHMKDGNPRVVAVNELLENKGLRPAEQDLLELILMAGCSKVGAPIMSAFSRAAELVGGCKIVALPPHLNNSARILAYDALLDRVIDTPDSFYRPGDLAQSIPYAVNHAINTGRARPLVRSLSDNTDLLDRFPFLYPDLARAALAAEMLGRAYKLAELGLANPKLRNRDRPACEQIFMMASAKAGNHIKTSEMTSRFLTMSFRGDVAQISPEHDCPLSRHSSADGFDLG
ncbi:hypothetical protein, partial [Paracoccus marcusii]|uniref:hypothetical protein n=1 Tax=Paracoccus marcusii TaxID=59779 RepID=UPI002492E53D